MLLALGIVHRPAPLLYARPFIADNSPVSAVNPEFARSLARPKPALLPLEGEVLRAFHPGRARMERSVCLAARLRGRWLYADQTGAASYAGRQGAFDVLAWDRLLRREPSLRGVFRSYLTRVRVHNRTAARLTLTDGRGFLRASVPARASRVAETWPSPHNVRLDGRIVGWVDGAVQYAYATKEEPVRLIFGNRKQVEAGAGLGGSGGVDEVDLIAEPRRTGNQE